MADETTAEGSPTETPREPEVALIDNGRAELYKMYEDQETPKAEAPKTEEKVVAQPEASPKVEATAPPSDKGEVSVSPPAVGEKTEDRTQKTVPYDALHVEREKRKAQTQRANDLENRLQQALTAIEGLKKPAGEQDQEPITDYDGTLKKLQQELVEAKQQIQQLNQGYQQREVSEYTQRLESELERTERELSGEGYPGFRRFQPQVKEELLRLVQEDPENAAVIKKELDNPAGWKRIFKEVIFPEYRGVFVQEERKGKQEEKINAKKDAALVGSPGRVESPQKEKDEWTANDYFRERSKRQIS